MDVEQWLTEVESSLRVQGGQYGSGVSRALMEPLVPEAFVAPQTELAPVDAELARSEVFEGRWHKPLSATLPRKTRPPLVVVLPGLEEPSVEGQSLLQAIVGKGFQYGDEEWAQLGMPSAAAQTLPGLYGEILGQLQRQRSTEQLGSGACHALVVTFGFEGLLPANVSEVLIDGLPRPLQVLQRSAHGILLQVGTAKLFCVCAVSLEELLAIPPKKKDLWASIQFMKRSFAS